jgi:predicted nucleotidyltransferase
MPPPATEAFRPPAAGDPVLREVVSRLVAVYHPLRIYLFGSAARGDAGPHSAMTS